MSTSLARLLTGLVAVLAVVGCSSEAPVAAPSRAELVALHVDAGLGLSVAQCLVGIGSQELEAALLVPDATRTADEEALMSALTESCQEAGSFVDGEVDDDPEELAFSDVPFTFGDDPELDGLWTACEQGHGSACDDLWQTAEIGSDYERFGMSCGDRPEILDCGVELTPETAGVDDDDADVESDEESDEGGTTDSEDEDAPLAERS